MTDQSLKGTASSIALDRAQLVQLYKLLGEALGAVEPVVGVNEQHARLLRYYTPAISTPVGNLGAIYRNAEYHEPTRKTVAYHQVDYTWQGQLIRALVRCEIGADGRPFVARQFEHKPVK